MMLEVSMPKICGTKVSSVGFWKGEYLQGKTCRSSLVSPSEGGSAVTAESFLVKGQVMRCCRAELAVEDD